MGLAAVGGERVEWCMTFLAEPVHTAAVQALHEDDLADLGYVMNLTRVWSHHPTTHDGLIGLLAEVTELAGLSHRDRGIVVSATAATYGDSYCALAWGSRLADVSDPVLAVGVLTGDDSRLSDRERALATWARAVADDPNATTADEVDGLRQVGFDDRQIFALTTFIALRIAFSTVSAALGAAPDPELQDAAPPAVAATVTWGRPVPRP